MGQNEGEHINTEQSYFFWVIPPDTISHSKEGITFHYSISPNAFMKYFHEMHILKLYKIQNNEFISFYFVIFRRSS